MFPAPAILSAEPSVLQSQRDDGPLAILAHELRSPLATILLALQTIPMTRDQAAMRRAHGIAQRQARRAVRIIDDLWDVCASDHGKLVLRRESIELSQIVGVAVETAHHLIAAKSHRLSVSLPKETVTLFADPLRLEQVFTNLLLNAAKFTESGGEIQVRGEVVGEFVVLRIRDTGRGIASELLPRIFDLFQQGTRVERGDSSGLGLGLALVDKLVQAHGGRVSAASAGLGAGSEFAVFLPTRNP